MTTQRQSSVSIDVNSARFENSVFSLQDLTLAIKSLSCVPSLADVYSWLERFQVDWHELSGHVAFKPGTYARHLVVRGEHAEALVLCWRPGQKTPIHDHNGSIGAIRVCKGILWETMFSLDQDGKLGYVTGREWTNGSVTGAEIPDIHQIGNPEISGQDLITLHIYAPPLGVLNTYKVGTSEIGHYSPNDYTDGGGI